MNSLTSLFAEWSEHGAFVTIAEPHAIVSRSVNALLAESTSVLRDDVRLFTVVLDWLRDYADDLDVESLLAHTASTGVFASLGVLADVARHQNGSHVDATLDRIVDACRERTHEHAVEPFFHVNTRHPYMLKRLQREPDPIFLRWGYLAAAPINLRDKVGPRSGRQITESSGRSLS